jgi:hypothetical protein
MPSLLLLAGLWMCLPVASADDGRLPKPVYYLAVDATLLRAAPDETAPRVGKLRRFQMVTGREVVSGWLRVDGDEDAWLSILRENVLSGSLETITRRIFHAQSADWPERVKADVARGLIRPGFTANQVRLALGEPLARTLERSGDSVNETWTYSDRRVRFSHRGVREIEPVGAN